MHNTYPQARIPELEIAPRAHRCLGWQCTRLHYNTNACDRVATHGAIAACAHLCAKPLLCAVDTLHCRVVLPTEYTHTCGRSHAHTHTYPRNAYIRALHYGAPLGHTQTRAHALSVRIAASTRDARGTPAYKCPSARTRAHIHISNERRWRVSWMGGYVVAAGAACACVCMRVCVNML